MARKLDISRVTRWQDFTHIMIAMKEPYGICKRVVLKVLKPKPLITSVSTDRQWRAGSWITVELTIRSGTVGDIGKETQEKVQVRLGVFCPFGDLIPA